MVGERERILFTSCEESANERVSAANELLSLRFFTTSHKDIFDDLKIYILLNCRMLF